MDRVIPWWDGRPVAGDAVALALFHGGIPAAAHPGPRPLLAAAAGDPVGSAVLIAADQVANFLKCHVYRRLVCHGAGPWHASLLAAAGGDPDAADALWGFSRDSRLVDVELLDAALRRRDAGRSGRRTLAEITRDVGLVGVPTGDEVSRRVAAAAGDPDELAGAALSLAAAVARSTLAASDRLRRRAFGVTADDDVDRFARTRRLAAAADMLTEGVAEAADSAARCGLLGAAGDARRAVAASSAARRPPAIDPEAWARFADWNDGQIEAASRDLLADPRTSRVFRHAGGRVGFTAAGVPRVDLHRLRGWLAAAAGGLRDADNCPATWPGGDPPADPTLWWPWTACDRTLGAWRRLYLAGRTAAWVDGPAGPGAVPSAWPRPAAEVDWVCSTGHAVFRPPPGRRFLVVRLEGPRACCLAALCRARTYSLNGRLAGLLLDPESHAAFGPDPFESAAALLRAYATRDAGGGVRDGETLPDEVADVQAFAALRESDPEQHRGWVRRTRGLLDVIPLGLTDADSRAVLRRDYGIDVGAAEYRRLGHLMAEHVATELRGLRADDTLDTLAARLGVDFFATDAALTEPSAGAAANPETAAAHARNVLLGRRAGDPVWRSMAATPAVASGAVRLGPELLHVRGRSLGGRPTGLGFAAQVRREEVDLSAEEAAWEVAYAGVASGLDLAAVSGEDVVFMADGAAVGDGQRDALGQAAAAALARLLGPVRVPLRVSEAGAW